MFNFSSPSVPYYALSSHILGVLLGLNGISFLFINIMSIENKQRTKTSITIIMPIKRVVFEYYSEARRMSVEFIIEVFASFVCTCLTHTNSFISSQGLYLSE